MKIQTIELLVDGTPYDVKVKPYDFNGQRRFEVSFNGSDTHIFVYDTQLKQLTAIGDGSDTIPANLEEAISNELIAGYV